MIFCLNCKEKWLGMDLDLILSHYNEIHVRNIAIYPLELIEKHFIFNDDDKSIDFNFRHFLVYSLLQSIILPILWIFYDYFKIPEIFIILIFLLPLIGVVLLWYFAIFPKSRIKNKID